MINGVCALIQVTERHQERSVAGMMTQRKGTLYFSPIGANIRRAKGKKSLLVSRGKRRFDYSYYKTR